MKTYLFVYSGSLLLAMVLTPLANWLGRRFNIVDVPGLRKVHSKPIPRIGGLAVYASVMCLAVPVFFLPNRIGDTFRETQPKVVTLLLAATVIFLVGLIDDVKQLRARTKLLAQLVAAILVCSVGIQIKSIVISDLLTVHFGWLCWPLTILWIVGITNAVNLSDGLDGLAAGISAIACGVIAVFAITSGQVVMAVLMLALLGALAGFLCFNFSPAKIFLGDGGSQFLGFTIGASSVMCSMKSPTLVALALPVLALGVPIFDTLFSILRRFLQRRGIMSPDRSHFHHKLTDLGLKQHHVAIFAYLVTLVTSGFGLFMLLTRSMSSVLVFLSCLSLLLLVFRLVGSVELRKTMDGIRKRAELAHKCYLERKRFEEAQLHFQNVQTFDDWWDCMCMAAKVLDLARLSLEVANQDKKKYWHWQNGHEDAEMTLGNLLQMKVPLKDRRQGQTHNIEIDILTNGSLESAGRRGTLFARLVDENSLEKLNSRGQTDNSAVIQMDGLNFYPRVVKLEMDYDLRTTNS